MSNDKFDAKGVQGFAFDQPSIYSIWVEGYIDPKRSGWLAGMEVQPSRWEDGMQVTLLRGELSDQAALVGLLNGLYQMHFIVLKVLRTGAKAYTTDHP